MTDARVEQGQDMATGPDDEPFKPIRAAVFHTVEAADDAVNRLLDAGFDQEQVSVLCSEAAREDHFRDFERVDASGSQTAESATKGGIAGAVFGGLTTAGLATATGVSLLAAGPSSLMGGAVVGSFLAAMESRGEKRALADYYDQALTRGDLLVAVEDRRPGGRERLDQAAGILENAGSEPVPLDDAG